MRRRTEERTDSVSFIADDGDEVLAEVLTEYEPNYVDDSGIPNGYNVVSQEIIRVEKQFKPIDPDDKMIDEIYRRL